MPREVSRKRATVENQLKVNVFLKLIFYRGIAQLVARLSGGQEVMSSSLVTPTKKNDCIRQSFFYFL